MEKNTTTQIDTTDRLILSLLQADAKLTIKELAAKLHLTSTPIHERIKKLEKEGYIKGYVAQLDRQRLALGLLVFCNVTLEAHHSDFIAQFETDVQGLKEVVECYHVAGMFDYLLKVVVADMETYQQFVTQKLAALPNIRNVQSFFVMTEVKEGKGLPLL